MFRWIIASLLLVLWCGGSVNALAETFMVDADQSEIRILLYKEGALSPLAHNHVIVSNAVGGHIEVFPQDIPKSSFQLTIPVTSLIVDDPKHRQEEGEGFDSEISPSDQQEIRQTMLEEDILAANKFPEVTVRSRTVSQIKEHLETTSDVTIKGKTRPLKTRLELSQQGSILSVSGSVKLKQSEFGIEPISLFLGTIKVQDEFVVKFHIVARSSAN